MTTYRPQNFDMHIKFDAESECLVPRTTFVFLDQVFFEKRNHKKVFDYTLLETLSIQRVIQGLWRGVFGGAGDNVQGYLGGFLRNNEGQLPGNKSDKSSDRSYYILLTTILELPLNGLLNE